MPLPLSSVRASVVESDGDPLAPNADPALVDGSAPLDQIRSGNGCNKQGEKERERESEMIVLASQLRCANQTRSCQGRH